MAEVASVSEAEWVVLAKRVVAEKLAVVVPPWMAVLIVWSSQASDMREL
jgi:hypothetical protein